MKLLLGDADGPIGLLLALAASERLRVEGGHPPSLTRPARAVKDREHAVRVVHDGNLQRVRCIRRASSKWDEEEAEGRGTHAVVREADPGERRALRERHLALLHELERVRVDEGVLEPCAAAARPVHDDGPVSRRRDRDDLLADVPDVLLQPCAADEAHEAARGGDEDRAAAAQPDRRVVEGERVGREGAAAEGERRHLLAGEERHRPRDERGP